MMTISSSSVVGMPRIIGVPLQIDGAICTGDQRGSFRNFGNLPAWIESLAFLFRYACASAFLLRNYYWGFWTNDCDLVWTNSSIVNNANQNLLKVNQTITAKADSTYDHNSSSQRPPVAIDPKTGVPFKKHHHSVKKFQNISYLIYNFKKKINKINIKIEINLSLLIFG